MKQTKIIKEIEAHFPNLKLNWVTPISGDCLRLMLDSKQSNLINIEWSDSISVQNNGLIFKSINYNIAAICQEDAIRIIKERLLFINFK